MQKIISVIIPAHNEDKYIKDVLDSIKKNSYVFELIVVCDSCIDDTKQVSSFYTNLVFDVDFQNVSKSRNFGAQKSSGDILIFLDADTLISDNYFEEVIKAISDYDYGCARHVNESNSIVSKYIAWQSNSYFKKGNIGGNLFIKRDFFNKVSGFNENMKRGEDTDLGERLKKVGAKYCFLEKCYIIPSERRYKSNGYFLFIFETGIRGLLYKFFRKFYDKKIASKFYD